CAERKPVVFTSHDCSSFTGGCIYPFGCERYIRNCGQCPQLGRMEARLDFTTYRLEMNRSIAKQKGIQYVFPSRWLRELACRSASFARDTEVIPNAIALEPYKFRCKADARRELGLQQEQKIIIVAAH